MPLQGAGGGAGRRGDVFDEAVGAAGAQDAADLGEDVGGVGHRAQHERGDHAVDAVVGQVGVARRHGRGGRGARPCARRRPAAVGACGGWVRWRRAWPRRAGSGGWRPPRSRARRPPRGSSPKTRRLCARRFHSRYGPIRRKNTALKRPRAPCTSKPGAGDMAMAESITDRLLTSLVGRSPHCAPIRPACQAWNYLNSRIFSGRSRWAAYQAAIWARDRNPRRRRIRST